MREVLLTDLSDEQCEKVVGGVGRIDGGQGFGAGAGTAGWFGGIGGSHGLFGTGLFAPGFDQNAGPNDKHVVRPVKL